MAILKKVPAVEIQLSEKDSKQIRQGLDNILEKYFTGFRMEVMTDKHEYKIGKKTLSLLEIEIKVSIESYIQNLILRNL